MERYGEKVSLDSGQGESFGTPGLPGKQTLTSSFAARATPSEAPSTRYDGASTSTDAFWFAGPAPAAAAPGGAADTAPLLVEDGGKVGPNQMTKGEFLRELHTLMPGEDLAPWMSKPCAALEQDVRKRVPGAASAHSARDYLSAIRVQAGTQAKAGTGPQAGEARAALMAAGESEHAATEYVRAGGLGAGQALASSTRAAMESAFQTSFAGVRIHSDANAQSLAGQLHARAFTVGDQITFGAGGYAPGTPVGDALLAHELAHVVQQRGSTSTSQGNSAALDADADHAASYAVSALHGGERSARAPAMPSMRSGVGVQRCDGGSAPPAATALTFSSASFSPGAGGASTATVQPASLYITTSGYSSSAGVAAAGGTDADAAGWDVGYLQLLRSTSRKGHYVGSPAATQFNVVVPPNTRDSLNGATPPWYKSSSPGMKAFSKTASTETVSLGDQPQGPFPWDTPDGKGKLDSVDGKDSFMSWVIVRKRASPNTIQYINWETWEAGFDATTNYASGGAKTVKAITGATSNTGSGAGQGAGAPSLGGGTANSTVTMTWT